MKFEQKSLVLFLMNSVTAVVGIFPIGLWYQIRPLGVFFLNNVVGYRKRTIGENLKNSRIDHNVLSQYYGQLYDYLIETMWIWGRKDKDIMPLSFKMENTEELYSHDDQPVFVLCGHLGNWECALRSISQGGVGQSHLVYKKLSSVVWDSFVYDKRQAENVTLLESGEMIRHIIGNNQRSVYFILNDQFPGFSDNNVQLTFLNQKTDFDASLFRLAARQNIPCYYAEVTKDSRGKYKADFELIYNGENQTDGRAILGEFAQKLEDNIKRNPKLWLWSHRRWKSREESKRTH